MFVKKLGVICATINFLIICIVVLAVCIKSSTKSSQVSIQYYLDEANDKTKFFCFIDKVFLNNSKKDLSKKNFKSNSVYIDSLNNTVDSLKEALMLDSYCDDKYIAKAYIYLILVKHHLKQDYSNYLNELSKMKNTDNLVFAVLNNNIKNVNFDTVKHLQNNIKDIWFQNEIITMACQSNSKLLHQYNNELISKFKGSAIVLVSFGIFMLISVIIGIIAIFKSLKNLKIPKYNSLLATTQKNNFSAFDSLVMFEIFFITQVVISIFVEKFDLKDKLVNTSQASIFQFVVYFIVSLAIFLYIWLLSRQYKIEFFKFINLKMKTDTCSTLDLVKSGYYGFCANIVIIFAVNFLLSFVLQLKPSTNPILKSIQSASDKNDFMSLILLFITISILAPIAEETLFRQFIFRSIKISQGTLNAMLFSSFLFALMHFDFNVGINLFCLGCVFAYLSNKFDSIFPNMVCHAFWNSYALVSIFILNLI